jgi:hypothetical protein
VVKAATVWEFVGRLATPYAEYEVAQRMADFKYSKQPKPEWEIIEYKWDGKIFYSNSVGEYFPKIGSGWMPGCVPSIYSIHSVKRLSDGEVFTVGDAVEIEGAKSMRPIYRFSLDDGTLMVHFHEYATVSFNMISAAPKVATVVYLTPIEIEKLHKILNKE